MRNATTRVALRGFAILYLAQPIGALAQSSEAAVIDDLLQCMSIEDGQRRLECYDSRLRQVADLTPEGAGEAAQTFTGSGNWQSEPFVMERQWRLAWQANTDLLTVQLTGPTPLQQQTVVDNHIGSGAGRSSPQEAGEYRIDVRALGEWQILAVEE
jgi:hypothetical protein